MYKNIGKSITKDNLYGYVLRLLLMPSFNDES
jgi:hypothetical protein